MNIFYLVMEVDNRGLALLPLFKALFSVSTLIVSRAAVSQALLGERLLKKRYWITRKT
jgi:hypothetical protein